MATCGREESQQNEPSRLTVVLHFVPVVLLLLLLLLLLSGQVVHGTASQEAITEKLTKWSTAAGKEVRFVKEL